METRTAGKQNDEAEHSKKRRRNGKQFCPPTSEAIQDISESKELLTDFDLMMAHKRKKTIQRPASSDIDRITKNNVRIVELMETMRQAADQDRQLNLAGKPATKKISLLKYVMAQMIKKDLQFPLLEHGLLNVLAEWISPLPNKALPCLQIRESILKLLVELPAIEKPYLKQSGIGKAVMYLFKHPEETNANRKRAEQLINGWCRTIYSVSTDFKAMSCEERRKLELLQTPVSSSSSSTKNVQQEHPLWLDEREIVPLRSSNADCTQRARVPMPSDKAYVVRPKSKMEVDVSNASKRDLNRYEKHLKMLNDRKRKGVLRPFVNLSNGGRYLDF